MATLDNVVYIYLTRGIEENKYLYILYMIICDDNQESSFYFVKRALQMYLQRIQAAFAMSVCLRKGIIWFFLIFPCTC